MELSAVPLTYLQHYITLYKGVDMSDAVFRVFLLYSFGLTFFSNQNGMIRLGYLAALANLDQLHNIDKDDPIWLFVHCM